MRAANQLEATIAQLAVMLTPRGQAGLEAKMLSSASDSASTICPRHVVKFLFWPRENECNARTGNHCEFAMIIYQSYLLTYLVFLI